MKLTEAKLFEGGKVALGDQAVRQTSRKSSLLAFKKKD